MCLWVRRMRERTKDWQLAVILGILFISRLYTFLLKYPKNEPLFISYNFSFDRKDHIFLTCLSRWGSGEDSGNCIDPLRASGTTNMLFFWSTHFHLPKCYAPGSGQNCLPERSLPGLQSLLYGYHLQALHAQFQRREWTYRLWCDLPFVSFCYLRAAIGPPWGSSG